MSKPTWIHIGFPKCASTSLQRDFFVKSAQISYVGRSDDWHDLRESQHIFLMKLATLDDAHYQLCENEVKIGLKTALAAQSGVVDVISDELLVSSYRPYLRGIPVADSYLIMHRLKEIFPDAKILMVIRDQVKFLSSMIGQLMRNNHVVFDADDFMNEHMQFAKQGLGSFLNLIDYNRIYEMYAGLFGADNIHLVLLESLAKEPERQMDYLLQKMGLDTEISRDSVLLGKHNTRATNVELWNYKYRNSVVKRFIPKWMRRVLRGGVASFSTKQNVHVDFSKADLAFLSEFYGPGNRRLEEQTGLDLHSAGYLMGEGGV